LDGDNRRGRVSEAVKAYRELTPATVVVSGEDWLVDHLQDAGIPPSHIRQDKQSATTRQQMDMVTALRSQRSVAIIASRLQMPRVAALARQKRIALLLRASPVDIEPPTSGFRALLPSYAGLRVSRDAFYERVALCYYQSRGWIRASE
jgi:hypothetical protein